MFWGCKAGSHTRSFEKQTLGDLLCKNIYFYTDDFNVVVVLRCFIDCFSIYRLYFPLSLAVSSQQIQ